MTYISWAAMYEGSSDAAYFEVLLPRVMQEIVALHGERAVTVPNTAAATFSRGPVNDVARSICGAREAFHLVFIHSDTGGRNLEEQLTLRSCAYCAAIQRECDWPASRCVVIAPRHETEAWILADPGAVTDALGWRGSSDSIGLPTNGSAAEGLQDPKITLEQAVRQVRGRRSGRPQQYFAAIAQRQELRELRGATSFRSFEAALYSALVDLGCVRRRDSD
ncbi:DUF4276 family protein [Methylocystis hirsuta]|uniref:DUF4276 family protein n=1 Tax=Methylocystis hirsuta TaxID=369798 RepID=A0A3M9XLS2_9HYPH|nr:DUF4276 family protein [Methylocystis hirsuta]